VLRAAVEAVCAELMEVEVARQIGAERGERRPEDRMSARSHPTRHSRRGRPHTIASTSSRGAIAASSSTRRPSGPRSDRRGVPRRAGERVDGRSAARASSCWP